MTRSSERGQADGGRARPGRWRITRGDVVVTMVTAAVMFPVWLAPDLFHGTVTTRSMIMAAVGAIGLSVVISVGNWFSDRKRDAEFERNHVRLPHPPPKVR